MLVVGGAVGYVGSDHVGADFGLSVLFFHKHVVLVLWGLFVY